MNWNAKRNARKKSLRKMRRKIMRRQKYIKKLEKQFGISAFTRQLGKETMRQEFALFKSINSNPKMKMQILQTNKYSGIMFNNGYYYNKTI